ncbi:glutathione hydrolase 1 proenzyme-like [Haemaphysalis longicornis]
MSCHRMQKSPPAAKGGFPIFLCCVVCLCCVLIIATLLGVLAFLVYPIIADAYFFPTELWEYKDFAVVCDAPLCAGVAKQIYDKGGLIGDIAVAALLCMGVTAPHLAGLGGGFMALYYNQSTGEIEGLDALGASPAAATVDTYTNNKSGSEIGAKAPIVPGAYAGYKLLHKKYGKMKWKDLFEPAIKLAQSGFKIGAHLAFALQVNQGDLGSVDKAKLVEKVKFALAKRQTIEDNTFVEDRLYDKISGSFKQDFLEWASRKSFKDYNLDLGLIPDYGGAQLSIRDAQGNALSITSGLNHEFGSKFWTSNGILMNSYMDAFPQKGRFFSAEQDPITKNPPGKDMRPLTSLMPTIILNGNQKGPRLHAVMGATGGLAAISALAQDHMLIKRNNTVLKEPFQQTATAIMTTARNSWMAPADVVHADGSSAGEPYKHPLWNNKRS